MAIIVPMRVPNGRIIRSLVMPVDGHQRHTGLDQASSQQAPLAEQVWTVRITHPLWFVSQVKRISNRRRRQQLMCLAIPRTQIGNPGWRLKCGSGLVKLSPEKLSIGKSCPGQISGQDEGRG